MDPPGLRGVRSFYGPEKRLSLRRCRWAPRGHRDSGLGRATLAMLDGVARFDELASGTYASRPRMMQTYYLRGIDDGRVRSGRAPRARIATSFADEDAPFGTGVARALRSTVYRCTTGWRLHRTARPESGWRIRRTDQFLSTRYAPWPRGSRNYGAVAHALRPVYGLAKNQFATDHPRC